MSGEPAGADSGAGRTSTLTAKPPMWLLMAMMASSQLAITIYLPSLASLAEALDTTQTAVQLTMTLYLAAFAVAQLIVGPLADAFGRRAVALGGLGLFTVASAISAMAPTIEVLLAGRALQALGSVAGIVLSRAVIRDVATDAADSARGMAQIGAAMAIAPAIAPFVGGLLDTAFGWRSTFWATTVVGAAVFAATAVLMRETLPAAERRPTPGVSALLSVYAGLVRLPSYLGNTLNVAFLTGGFHGLLAAAPLVLITALGVSPALFGLYTLFAPAGFLLGNLICTGLSRRFGMVPVTRAGNLLSIAGVGVLLGLAVAGTSGLAAILAPIFVIGFGSGLVLPNCLAGAMNAVRPNAAGAASAFIGFAQMILGTAATLAVAGLTHTSAVAMAAIMATGMVMAFVSYVALTRPRAPAVALSDAD